MVAHWAPKRGPGPALVAFAARHMPRSLDDWLAVTAVDVGERELAREHARQHR